ncbi:hypothetical protein E2562_021661 [Oryza meyeriana var. granulata]|uniref:Uncharacterized protein n=1 Tax=Oryza meyeriana var. granulata TaxID=110450 RepID=A0A6G1DYI5_9ORYZ|nr:hypothetical protein E2562_021661 [Oryza meyeriana var. granulata]
MWKIGSRAMSCHHPTWHRRRCRARVELELPLGAPSPDAAPFDLEAAVCSHGLFMMAPNR